MNARHPIRHMLERRADQRNCIAMMCAASLGLLAISAGEAVGMNSASKLLREPAWSLIYTSSDGNAYVMDHGLTSSDCRDALASVAIGARRSQWSCEGER